MQSFSLCYSYKQIQQYLCIQGHANKAHHNVPLSPSPLSLSPSLPLSPSFSLSSLIKFMLISCSHIFIRSMPSRKEKQFSKRGQSKRLIPFSDKDVSMRTQKRLKEPFLASDANHLLPSKRRLSELVQLRHCRVVNCILAWLRLKHSVINRRQEQKQNVKRRLYL